MASETRVTWDENRSGELFLIIADLETAGWEFWDRSSWEQRWYPLPATAERIEKAERLLSQKFRAAAA